MSKGIYIGLTLALFALVSIWGQPTFAVNPSEILADPILESRAREISKGLRCLVCQNQSIDDSDADLAKDLRLLVRERLSAGDSNERVIQFVVSRYGDFVLMKPPFKMSTLALWLGPLVIILKGDNS
jgi:cytochrome c-type biogenesis protein CcmH